MAGKYKLGGDWVKKMPKTLEWFNRRLQSTIFPAAAALFPEVVDGPEVLRAHSVAILKYNLAPPALVTNLPCHGLPSSP